MRGRRSTRFRFSTGKHRDTPLRAFYGTRTSRTTHGLPARPQSDTHAVCPCYKSHSVPRTLCLSQHWTPYPLPPASRHMTRCENEQKRWDVTPLHAKTVRSFPHISHLFDGTFGELVAVVEVAGLPTELPPPLFGIPDDPSEFSIATVAPFHVTSNLLSVRMVRNLET